MRSLTLTRDSTYVDGRLCHAYEFEGETFLVCDSAKTALLTFELFADEELIEEDKQTLLLDMLFPDPASVFQRIGTDRASAFLASVLWDAFGIDVLGDKGESSEKIFDWQEDAARIEASFLKAYGIPWQKASANLSFLEVCALLGALLEDETTTPFQQAIYYRTAKRPDFGKGNEKSRDAWDAARRHFSLKGETKAAGNSMIAANDTSRDLFAALKAVALRGGDDLGE